MKNLPVMLFLILIFTSNCFAQQSRKIINGDEVTSLVYPWMVELADLNSAFESDYFCGGALIAPQWIVTAASCMERYSCHEPTSIIPSDLEVVAGSYDLSLPQQRIKVAEIIKHPDFDCWTLDFDIALLKLETPVYLPTLKVAFSDPPVGTEAVTMGWGTMNPEREEIYPDILREIRMTVIPYSECKEAYTDYNDVTTNMICTVEEGKGICFGDSGGPLVVKKGEWFLAGITSWGWDECAVSGYPNVFTRVSQFTDFLKQHIPDIYLLRYDCDSDKKISLQDAVYVIRSIAVENSGHDISDAVEILQVIAGMK